MRRMWAAGAVMLVCLALGGVPALAQDSSPVPAQDEVLYEITVPPEAIPDSLGKIVVDEWTVAPGTDVSIPYDNEGILGRGMYLESGGLTVTPAYDALLWTGEAARGGSPVSAPAGVGVALAAGDVLLLPAVPRDQLDPAAEVGIANPGKSDAQIFAFHMHWWESFPGWPEGIRSTPGITFGLWDELTRVAAGDTTFRLTRLSAQPGEALPFPDDAAFVFDYLTSGALSDWTILGSGPTERAVDVKRPQHIVAGDAPAEVLELAVIPSAETVTEEPEASAAAGNAWVTGTMACGLAGQGTSQEDDSVRLDQFPGQCSATMSDPRVGGTSESDIQEACFKLPGEPCMMFGTTEIAGPDGTWVGTFGSVNDATLDEMPAWVVLEGTGAYEGWTYVSFTPDQLDPNAVVAGILYEGPPPPWGETLPLSSAEE